MTSNAFTGGKEGLTNLVHLDQGMFVYLRREVSWVPRKTQRRRGRSMSTSKCIMTAMGTVFAKQSIGQCGLGVNLKKDFRSQEPSGVKGTGAWNTMPWTWSCQWMRHTEDFCIVRWQHETTLESCEEIGNRRVRSTLVYPPPTSPCTPPRKNTPTKTNQ